MNYEYISTQAGDVIRYKAKKTGYAIFSSLPFNFIATNHIAIQLNDDTLIQIPINKNEEIRAILPLELVKFIPYEEAEHKVWGKQCAEQSQQKKIKRSECPYGGIDYAWCMEECE